MSKITQQISNSALSNVHQYGSEKSFVTDKSISITRLDQMSKNHQHHPSLSQLHEDAWESNGSNKNSTDKEKYIHQLPEHAQNLKLNEPLSTSSEATHHEIKNIWINQKGSINDHHQQKRRKNYKRSCLYRKKYLCICLSTIFLCIAIAIVLAIVLTTLERKNSPLITPALRWNTSGITIVGTGGVPGKTSNLLNVPYGLGFDSSETLYIADHYNNRIQKLITSTSNCVTVAGHFNGTSGITSDRLNQPVGILFDSSDNMYVADRLNHRVQLWVKDATYGITVAGGNTSISLARPSGLARDPDSGTIYISESSNHRVTSYPSGIVVAAGNGAGYNKNQLNVPYGLTYESISKSLIISNGNANNIVRWTLGANSWTHVAGNITGGSGNTSTLLNLPVGSTIDPMGNIYVADATNHRIQFFLAGEPDGKTIAGITGVSGVNSTLLKLPYWIILDKQLNLYVADTFNHRVQKFLRY
ncbi:unnamed protein product [Rotaria sordida]|uniref:NHL repeat-containing protein n=1 Tax=Rotaria sordida TaxID=392033 RepID=A0A815R7X2_9BILA|nr:unnamed protein product [Rotaria sordida]CAF1645694.1 unnamed protein product [Rotaria sordida]